LVREVIRHPGAVVIVPVLDDQRVCLIRNYRVAVERELIELPAGTREPSEPPELTAHRELQEETGFSARELIFLREILPSPGILDERMSLYLARGLQTGRPHRESGEQIDNLIVTWDDALQRIDSGEIVDAKTIVGLLVGHRALAAGALR
jgi:ADP-ribose pyrophosphatase